MNAFVLSGDGFSGWPTNVRLSKLGRDITIIDDLSRRSIDRIVCTSIWPREREARPPYSNRKARESA